jgi:RNA polymerase sigma-70 factor, ECF subfamily
MEELFNQSDEAIVELVRSQDQEKYAVLVDRYQYKLLRYVTSLIQDENKATDAVQETFIKAFVNLNGFDISKKFSSWLYRIAHNEAMNAVKKYHKEIPLPEGLDLASKQDIEEDFIQKETSEKIKICLSKLPVIYAEPLVLRYLEEKSYDEISDILHLPLGTVGTRINRAKILMKHLCQNQ